MTHTSDPILPAVQVPPIAAAIRAGTGWAAVAAIAIGGLGLLGWASNHSPFKTPWSGLVGMELPNALAFALSGASLWLKRPERVATRSRPLADVCAAVVIVVGAVSILYRFGPGGAAGPSAPAAGVLFVATGIALLLLDVEDRREWRPAQFILLPIGLFALALLLGDLFGILSPPKIPLPSSMPWLSALTFFLLSVGALCARPDRGVVRVITASEAGGGVARRLLPAAVAVPPLLCVLSYLGYAARWYGVGFGLALMTALNSGVLTALVWRAAGRLNQTDTQRSLAEVQRNELNKRLRLVLDAVPAAIVYVDREGRYRFGNRLYTERFGLSPEDIQGRLVEEVLGAEAYAVIRPQVDAALRGETISFDAAMPYPNLGLRHVKVDYVPESGEGGVGRGFVVMVTDITERAQAEEALRVSERRLAGILESAMDAILTVDEGTNILLFNQAAERMFRCPAREAVGMPLERFLPGRFDGPGGPLRRIGEAGAISGRRADGEDLSVEASVSETEATGRKLYTIILREITERERAGAELARHVAEIEDLNRRLRHAMTETHHRVKNSLQLIAAMIDMQAMEAKGGAVPVGDLRRIGNQIGTLASVHDLLTQSAKDGSAADQVAARSVLGRLLPMLQHVASGRLLEFRVAGDAALTVRQGTSLAFVANELVSNAVKHGNGRVEVNFAVEGAEARLEVSDDGPGFPREFSLQEAAHTGLELVEQLSRWDLEGSTSYGNGAGGGAHVTVIFPVQPGHS